MAGSRERARGLLLKALYQWQLAGHSREELLTQYADLAEFARIDQKYFEDLLDRVLADSASLDALIAQLSARGLGQPDPGEQGIDS